LWETTNEGTLGGDSYTSADNGNTWVVNHGKNQVFTVSGFCDYATGIKADDSQKISYYPNPVNDFMTISSDKKIKNISVYSVFGQKIKIQEMNFVNGTVNMSSLSTGIYFIRTELEGGQIETFKINKM
jgi:hypothetical protein